MDQKFGKAYKLCSKKIIDAIFIDKKTVKKYPLIINYKITEVPSDKNFQVVISVPKRIFKKAHDRNKIKRLMREAFRKKKLNLENYLQEQQIQLAFFLVYTSSEELTYHILEEKMEQLLNNLINDLKA